MDDGINEKKVSTLALGICTNDVISNRIKEIDEINRMYFTMTSNS